jgi:hypothetical protein
MLEALGFRDLAISVGKQGRGGDRRQEGRDLRLGQRGIGRRIAVEPLILEGTHFICIFDAGGVVRAAQGAAGIVALLLEGADLAVVAAKDIHHLRERAKVGFDGGGTGGFLEENLGQPGGGGLEADFGQLGGILAA